MVAHTVASRLKRYLVKPESQELILRLVTLFLIYVWAFSIRLVSGCDRRSALPIHPHRGAIAVANKHMNGCMRWCTADVPACLLGVGTGWGGGVHAACTCIWPPAMPAAAARARSCSAAAWRPDPALIIDGDKPSGLAGAGVATAQPCRRQRHVRPQRWHVQAHTCLCGTTTCAHAQLTRGA